MKTRTIAKILAAKHAAWVKSIDDEAVRKLVQDNTIITGGSIVSLLTDQPVADFDCYFRNVTTTKAVADYYVKKLLANPPPAFKGDSKHKVEIFTKLEPAIEEDKEVMRLNGLTKGPQPARVRIVVKSAGIAGETKQDDYQYFEGTDPGEQARLTDAYVNAAMGDPVEGQITDDSEPGMSAEEAADEADNIPASQLDDAPKDKGSKGGHAKYRVLFLTSNAITLSDSMQLVIRFFGEPTEIHRNFDYQHALSYWTSWGEPDKRLVLNPVALECIMGKELRYVGSLYPLCSVIRMRKFLMRGWTINAGQIIKMLWQVNQLNLSDPMVLEDQLVGVDSAYFAQVIHLLKDKMEKDRAEGKEKVEVDGTYLVTLVDKLFG